MTEGSDGGIYVQAMSVGGPAYMAGNVNKGKLEAPFFIGAALIRRNLFAAGDRIVAINGQNLLHLRYEDALKMLQSS